MEDILGQCAAIQKEIHDCRQRAMKFREEIAKLDVVGDTVTGTRSDGTFGRITVRGYPDPVYKKKLAALCRVNKLVEEWEYKLLDKLEEAETLIESVEDSDTRIMFRLYLDTVSWKEVAKRMNEYFPGRRKRYTEDGCRMRYVRFLKGGDEADGKL